MVYLDNNATTPLKEHVKAAMQTALDVFGNPSSTYRLGQDARMAIDESRRAVSNAFDVRPEQVVFTSGGSEANNLCLRGYFAQNPEKTLVISSIEHSCVHQTALALCEDFGIDLHLLNTHKNGVVDLDDLKEVLQQKDVGLVSVMHANNETGVLQPIAEIRTLLKNTAALLHVDAVQTIGKIAYTFADLQADMATVSFHKMGGPKGVGAVILKPSVLLSAHITGGTQERSRRAGTENTLAIVGAGACCDTVFDGVAFMAEHVGPLRAFLECTLQEKLPHITIVGEESARVPNTTALILPKKNGTLLEGETAVMMLDLKGFAVSTGSACSSGRITPSRVLLSMGYSEEEAKSMLRISLGHSTTKEDITRFVDALVEIYA